MSDGWQERYYAAVADYLDLDGVITDIEEFTEYGGYCDTCSYEEQKVRVYRINGEGKSEITEHYYSMADLMRSV